jgi:hypothetical protein
LGAGQRQRRCGAETAVEELTTMHVGHAPYAARMDRLAELLSIGKYFCITFSTALCEMWISSSVGAAELEIFPHHSPNADRRRREFRPHGQSQATAFGWVQVSRCHSPQTSRKSWPCVDHEPRTTRRISCLLR